jgi:TPR repeat protein
MGSCSKTRCKPCSVGGIAFILMLIEYLALTPRAMAWPGKVIGDLAKVYGGQPGMLIAYAIAPGPRLFQNANETVVGRNGQPKDDREAARLFRLAADKGDAAAQANLGVFYEHGRGGLAKDDREAARLYRLAADQGNAKGQASLGFFYAQGRGGLAKDDQEAARLYRLAADQGNARGQSNLGDFCRDGRGGLAKDDREAARLYRLAADQGNADGQAGLAFFYAEGRAGLAKDEREAARLWRLAADQGNARGQANLGVLYEHGRGGLAKNEREAARLWRLAADQGNEPAQSALKRLAAGAATTGPFGSSDYEGFRHLVMRAASLEFDIGGVIAGAPDSAERMQDCLIMLNGNLNAFVVELNGVGALVALSGQMVEQRDEVSVLLALGNQAKAFVKNVEFSRNRLKLMMEKCSDDRTVKAEGKEILRIYEEAESLTRPIIEKVGASSSPR